MDEVENNSQISFLDKNTQSTPGGIRKTQNLQMTPNQLVIRDNYLLDPHSSSHSKSKSFYAGSIFRVNENSSEPKLYEQLIGKNRQKSFSYNTLVLLCFNINIMHFCFPYVTYKCGILLTFVILFLCGCFSYLVQSSLIGYITHERGNADQSNYAAIIESNFGSFCASFLEFAVMIWYGMLLLVCCFTGKKVKNKKFYMLIFNF